MNNKTNNNVNNEKKNVVSNIANGQISAKEIFKKFAENTAGILKTNLGTKKATLYKTEIFEGCTDKDKKTLRRKFRAQMYSLCKSIVSTKNAEQKQLIKAFNDFYFSAYQLNDYSLQSICNENLDSEKKKVLQDALNICKKENSK